MDSRRITKSFAILLWFKIPFEHRDALPKEIRAAIEKQILGVAMAVKKQ